MIRFKFYMWLHRTGGKITVFAAKRMAAIVASSTAALQPLTGGKDG